MGTILLKNIQLNDSQVDILIRQGIISQILPAGTCILEPSEDAEVLDCTRKAAVPGFINMHTHAGMSLMRGMKEDASFFEWLDALWKVEAKIDAEFVYWATKAAAIEMIRTGTTTFNDHYWYASVSRAMADEMGIRPFMCYISIDKMDPKQTELEKEKCIRMYEEFGKVRDGATFAMSFHAPYSVSEELIKWTADFAERHNLTLQFHLSETAKEVEDCKEAHKGLSPVEYLDRLGILNERCIAAHTLWLSDNDVRILGEHKVNCVHNINSNLKLSSGYRFKYKELREAGANVCIGTDGCASSNNLDMLEAMKTSSFVQKAWREDPTVWPLEEILGCATANGAKALRINSGVIEEGRDADILIVDTDNTFFLSPGPFLANFIYSAHSDCIESVIARGRFIMRNRVIPGEREILDNARKMLVKIM